jgi:glycosyltransferase involved in cell wall biosynthesis
VLVSVVIPACEAQATLARAVSSLRAQTLPDWEAIVVADDRFDYRDWLQTQGIVDQRLRFASTGAVRSGCHRARNVGLALARGDLVGALDADDLFRPERLAVLAPLALAHGAAADNLAVVVEETGATLYQPLGKLETPARVDLSEVLALTAPLVPLIRHDHALPRLDGVEYAEDVIANLRLIDCIGTLLVVPQALYEYRVIAGSIAHDDRAAEAFDAAYAGYIARAVSGDGLGLSPAGRAAAAAGLAAKRAFNQHFAAAQRAEKTLNFQTFAAGRRRRT